MMTTTNQQDDRATTSPILQKPLSFATVVAQGCNAPSSPRAYAKSFEACITNGSAKVKSPGMWRTSSVLFQRRNIRTGLLLQVHSGRKVFIWKTPMPTIRKFFASLGLKSLKSVGLIHEKHVVVFVNQEEDYSRLLLRSTWYVSGSPMKIIKWTLVFFPNVESPVVPVWVGFPGLPIHFFEKSVLYSLGSAFGQPLKLDEPTAMLTRPTVVRLCIELDVSKPRNHRLWIGSEKEGFWQEVVFEDPPSYCMFCEMLGHGEKFCFIKNPALKNSAILEKNIQTTAPKGKEKVQPIEKEGDWQIVKTKNKTHVQKANTQQNESFSQAFTQTAHPHVLKNANASSSQPTIPLSHPAPTDHSQPTIYLTPLNQQNSPNKQNKSQRSSQTAQSGHRTAVHSSSQQLPTKNNSSAIESPALVPPTTCDDLGQDGVTALVQQKGAIVADKNSDLSREQGSVQTGDNLLSQPKGVNVTAATDKDGLSRKSQELK